MRLILLATAAAALSACSPSSLFGSNFGFGQQNTFQSTAQHAGAYQGGGAYGTQQSQRYASNYGHQTQVQNGYAYSGQAPAYGAPVHVNPTGHNAGGYPQNNVGVPGLRGLSKVNSGRRFYTNLGGMMYDVDDNAFGVVGRVGVQQGVLGAELEGSAGLINDTQTFDVVVDGQPAELRTSLGTEWSTAAFATARAPVARRLDAFARAGYHITEIKAKASLDGLQLSDRAHSDGFAYGVGLEYAVDPRRALRLDYTRYESDDFRTSDSVSASFVSRF